jgi:hypothetical protein
MEDVQSRASSPTTSTTDLPLDRSFEGDMDVDSDPEVDSTNKGSDKGDSQPENEDEEDLKIRPIPSASVRMDYSPVFCHPYKLFALNNSRPARRGRCVVFW